MFLQIPAGSTATKETDYSLALFEGLEFLSGFFKKETFIYIYTYIYSSSPSLTLSSVTLQAARLHLSPSGSAGTLSPWLGHCANGKAVVEVQPTATAVCSVSEVDCRLTVRAHALLLLHLEMC